MRIRLYARLPASTCTAPGWDALRHGVIPSYRIPGQVEPPGPEAQAIATLARRLGLPVVSYGVGTATLERNLLGLGLEVVCTENAPRTVETLAALGLDVHLHDVARDAPIGPGLQLFHRLDTELDDETWRAVFARWSGPILFVPGGLLTPRRLAATLRARLLGGRKCGWLRTRGSLERLWSPSLEGCRLDLGGVTAYLINRSASVPP